jgi:transposase-like protein
MKCPYCKNEPHQIKSGRNKSGLQQYQCTHCLRHHTPEPSEHGYSEAICRQAAKVYVDGMNLERIARHPGVNQQSMANLVNAYATQLPPAPLPGQMETGSCTCSSSAKKQDLHHDAGGSYHSL